MDLLMQHEDYARRTLTQTRTVSTVRKSRWGLGRVQSDQNQQKCCSSNPTCKRAPGDCVSKGRRGVAEKCQGGYRKPIANAWSRKSISNFYNRTEWPLVWRVIEAEISALTHWSVGINNSLSTTTESHRKTPVGAQPLTPRRPPSSRRQRWCWSRGSSWCVPPSHLSGSPTARAGTLAVAIVWQVNARSLAHHTGTEVRAAGAWRRSTEPTDHRGGAQHYFGYI